MTDIVKELREVALVERYIRIMHLMHRAADEIEILREEVKQLREAVSKVNNTGCAGGPTWLT